MAKKTNLKKKISVKLEPGESYMVCDTRALTHMQKVYSDLIKTSKPGEELSLQKEILQIISESISNTHNVSSESFESDDEW